MPRKQPDSKPLGDLRRRLDGWRGRHGGRGRRIPDELWHEAAELARRDGVALVARVLRLRAERLAWFAGDLEEHDRATGGAEFVEVELPTAVVSAGSVFVHFEAPDGRRLQLEVPPTAVCDVGAIFAAFAGQSR